MTDYLQPLLGGLLIGFAATGLMYLLGRVAGISGILWSALAGLRSASPEHTERAWRWCFLAGLLLGPWLYHGLSGAGIPPAPSLGTPFAIVGGLLVGFGTRLGSGCTSGHGVCGIGRLSTRSLVATAVFMGTGILTVLIVRHALGVA
jgi:hypothetical protein